MSDYAFLRVSDNKRFLAYTDGSPFFYLADTAWELFHRCNREEADLYLRDRAAKKFTVIQAVALAELDGLRDANSYGDLPLVDEDPAQPNEAYFAHVDYIVDKAHDLGLFVGLLPTWGDKFNVKWGKGPEVFTPQNARSYGEFLGARYGGKNIIWIMGGDRDLESDLHVEIVRAMAEGIRATDGGQHLMTFHPQGGKSSSTYVHAERWLDFHMIQSGHRRYCPTQDFVSRDYLHKPTRPTLDGEPGYEDHPNHFNPRRGWLDQRDVRYSLYQSLFAGGCGYTYGCHDIWQMHEPDRAPVSWVRRSWQEALSLPGSAQVQHARALLESRSYVTRIPDQSVIVGDAFSGEQRLAATRCADGSYLLVYAPCEQWLDVNLSSLKSATAKASWLNPRTGVYSEIGEVDRSEKHTFEPPFDETGRDWVLVVDAI